MSLVLVYLKDGQAGEIKDVPEITEWVKKPAGPFWLDLISPTSDEIDWLAAAFSFHPLTIEDLRLENPRPKLEDYPGYVFLVLHCAEIEGGSLSLLEIHSFVSDHYIITAHAEQLEDREDFRHTFSDKAAWLKRGPDFCLYKIINNLANGYLSVVNGIDDELDSLQNEILSGSGLRNIEPIVTIRRQLATLRRIVAPTREVANELSLQEFPFVRRQTTVYYRDVHSLLVTIFDITETQRDVASNILDAHLSAVSNRLNDIMKRLTLVATIFLPLGFVASFGGMNFAFLPFDNPLFFQMTMASMVVIAILMLIWFKREGWF